MRRALVAALLRRAAPSGAAADSSLGAMLRAAACEQPWAGGLSFRGFASDGEGGAGAADGEDRRESGAQASTSSGAADGTSAGATAAPQSSLGRPQTTLEAKKAYRQTQRSRVQQQLQQRQEHVAEEQAAASPTLAAKQAARRQTRAKQEAAEAEPWQRLLAEKRTGDELTDADCGKYVEFDLDSLPEVFSTRHPDGQDLHPTGGCAGLTEELLANGLGLVMHRACGHALTRACLAGERKRVYLTGPPASGKSVALAATVSALRARGWLVLYVPQALQMTHGGFFSRRPAEGGGPDIDTPECARLALHYLLQAHPRRCEALDAGGASLAELCRQGVAAKEPAAVVDAFLRALAAVVAAPDAAVAIDNYQALYLPTAYGEWLSQHKRRVIQPEELRVASALRLLEAPEARAPCLVLAAASRGGSFSPRLRMPLPKEALFNIPRFDPAEWRSMALLYRLTGVTDELPEAKVAKAFLLTQGNAREYRRTASGLLDLELLQAQEAAAA